MYDIFPRARVKSNLGETTEVGLNVFMMPSSVAYQFIGFCYANYSSGSIVDFSDRGSPLLFARTSNPVDVRKAATAYDLMTGPEREQRVSTLEDAWTSDTVAVAVGCSVVVDRALVEAGIRLKHVEAGVPLAAYRTNLKTRGVGAFQPLQHVSMRIVNTADAARAIAITSCFPALHGAPVHIGNPAALGIANLMEPILGAGLLPTADETCLFWGCGVTLRKALEEQERLHWMANSEGSLAQSGRMMSSFATNC
jgi:uncharacterized protein YcsI (UPF0317 family)